MSLRTQALLCFTLAALLILFGRVPWAYRLLPVAVAVFSGVRLWRRDAILRARQAAMRARIETIDTTGESQDDDRA